VRKLPKCCCDEPREHRQIMLMQILKAKTPMTISRKKNYCATDTWIKSHAEKAWNTRDQSVIFAVLESYELDSRLSD